MKVYQLISLLFDVPAGMDAHEAVAQCLKRSPKRGRLPAVIKTDAARKKKRKRVS